MTRITATMINTDVQSGIQMNGVQLDDIMTQLSTGKAINQPSDDPVGTSKTLRLHSQTSRYDQYYRNMQDGAAWLSTADTALKNGNDVLQRANELGLQGANGTYSATERQYLRNEVRVLSDQMLSIASTSLKGEYIFSGTQTAAPPYSLASGTDTITAAPNANGQSLAAVPATLQLFDTTKSDSSTPTGNPSARDVLPGTVEIAGLTEGTDYTVDYRNGQVTFTTPAAATLATVGGGINVKFDWIRRSEQDLSGQVDREVQRGTVVPVNVAPDQAFGSKAQTSVFDSLIDLMDGLHTNNQTKIGTALPEVQSSLQRLLQAQTVAGSRENRLQATTDQNRSDALVVVQQTSEVESIDFTKLVSEYQNKQTVYEAAIRVGAQVIQPSLVKYL